MCDSLTRHSSNSLCERTFNKTQQEDKSEPLFGDEMPFVDFVVQDSPPAYEEKMIKEGQEGLENMEEEMIYSKELDLASDMLYGDHLN